jgi:hypothetical protein
MAYFHRFEIRHPRSSPAARNSRTSVPALENALTPVLHRLLRDDPTTTHNPLGSIVRIDVLRDGFELLLPLATLRQPEKRLGSLRCVRLIA